MGINYWKYCGILFAATERSTVEWAWGKFWMEMTWDNVSVVTKAQP